MRLIQGALGLGALLCFFIAWSLQPAKGEAQSFSFFVYRYAGVLCSSEEQIKTYYKTIVEKVKDDILVDPNAVAEVNKKFNSPIACMPLVVNIVPIKKVAEATHKTAGVVDLYHILISHLILRNANQENGWVIPIQPTSSYALRLASGVEWKLFKPPQPPAKSKNDKDI